MEQLNLIFNPDRLPRTARCTDNLQYGTRLRKLKTALKSRYIQINPPKMVFWLTYDVDRQGACLAWEDANLATPNFATKNRENAHAHLVYGLQVPVLTCEASRQKPLAYANAIKNAYTELLGADRGYSGLITKNPLNEFWEVLEGHSRLYDLAELAEWVPDLHKFQYKGNKDENQVGIGRNVSLFHAVRKWSYVEIRLFRGEGRKYYPQWLSHVQDFVAKRNGDFSEPLPFSEIKALAKSIANFCWINDPAHEQAFKARQQFKSKLGSSVGGIKRSEMYGEAREEAIRLHVMGNPIKAIAELLGVHRNTVSSWLKKEIE